MARFSFPNRMAVLAAGLLAAAPAFAQAPTQTPSTVTSGAPPANPPASPRPAAPASSTPPAATTQTPSAVTSSTPPADVPTGTGGAARNKAGGPTGRAPGGHAPDGHASERVERQLTMLRRRLEITSNQEQQWSAFAAVMRENAQHMDSLYAERQNTGTDVSAVEQLTAYEHVTEAHLQDLQRLVPAFATLYASFTPAQKQNADAIFRARAERAKQGHQKQANHE